jgi:hypothetical protein
MTNKELDNVVNEIPLQEDNIEKYEYPQNLYQLQLQRKAEIQFRKPATVDTKVFVNEWIRAFLVMINEVVVDLQKVCTCTKMTAGPDWQFLYTSHPKPIDYLAMDYAYHTLDTIQCLITNPSFYPSREHIPDKGYSAYANMCKRIYRILAHTIHAHPIVYSKYENEYSLCSRFVDFCLQFKLMKNNDLCHLK